MKYCLLNIMLLLASSMLMAQTPVKKIPDFVFYRLDKSAFTNKNIQSGKKVFFVFFDSDCDHCQHAVHDINQHYKEFSKAEIYLVTLDNIAKINSFLNKYGPVLINKPNVTILQDLNNQFIADFNPRKYPSMLLFSVKGNLLMYQDDPENMVQIFKQL
jgi:peroxiredoxin